jgi:hypothetical protein
MNGTHRSCLQKVHAPFVLCSNKMTQKKAVFTTTSLFIHGGGPTNIWSWSSVGTPWSGHDVYQNCVTVRCCPPLLNVSVFSTYPSLRSDLRSVTAMLSNGIVALTFAGKYLCGVELIDSCVCMCC